MLGSGTMRQTRIAWIGRVALGVALAGCGGGNGDARDFFSPGDFTVGVTSGSLTDTTRDDRTLAVEVWYPAESKGAASAVLDFETDSERRTTLSMLLDDAPTECVAKTTQSTRDASAWAGEYPLVLYSHCFSCTRWSAHAVMERLASHGYVVVAPDHTGDTLFDGLQGMGLPLDPSLVPLRTADIRFVLDRVLADDVLPNGLKIDPARVGMLGHSIGSVTAGSVADEDARIGAVLGVAAPMENPLFPGGMLASIDVPIGMLLATEDNSILEVGNEVIRLNFAEANEPAYRLDIVDAGHWSVTNIAGLTEGFAPGCGEGVRQTNGQPFTYLDVDTANDITATFVTAFFAAHLEGDADAIALLESSPWPEQAPLLVRD